MDVGIGIGENRAKSHQMNDVLPQVRLHLQESGAKVVVLDEDLSGTQTVHDLPVLTTKTVTAFTQELTNDLPGFYVLMNSRDLPARDANALYHRVMMNLDEARRQTGRDFIIISRGTTAERTHFPTDINALASTMPPHALDGVILVPTLTEQGTYTLDDTHFGHDSAMSALQQMRYWVNEQTDGRIKPGDIASLSIDTVRSGGPEAVRDQLMQLSDATICIANAVTRRDVDVIALGALMARARGKRFVFRSDATFAAAMNGIEPNRPLQPSQLTFGKGVGGLVVVGARKRRATDQLMHLLASRDVTGVEVRVESLLHDASQEAEVARCSDILNEVLKQGDAVLYTSRRIVNTHDVTYDWLIMQRINAGLVTILNGVRTIPRYIAAKGSVTASEIATRSLNVRRAQVAGQLMPGVPVWSVNGMSYVIVLGAADEPDTLVRLVKKLR